MNFAVISMDKSVYLICYTVLKVGLINAAHIEADIKCAEFGRWFQYLLGSPTGK
jgi:hypothetical protein